MKSPYLPPDDEAEVSQAAVHSAHVRANLHQVVLVFLAFHLGFFGHLFLEALPKFKEEPAKFAEKVAEEASSMEALESLVEKLPDDDFRACLQMVIGTAYAERCDALTLHLRPFMKRLLRDLETVEKNQASPAPPAESPEPGQMPRKRKKQKNHESPKPQKTEDGLLITSITHDP